MDDYRRPDPDELLARLNAEEKKQTSGCLKIFLGYAAGVGKTFAMLEAAHQRLREGQDVVIGYIETHGRVETEALVAGLPLIPRRMVDYRDHPLPEMDLDAILARKPHLVLVDELAHTNVPGCRHPKRYQDVMELLENGINVYTTLNIQHIESLNDAVQQITGVKVRETVPDSLIDETVEIELVDLPPDELLQRLKEGKVYVPDQASRAIELFFRKGNLTALREMSMRRAAQRVDLQMLNYMETKEINGPWPAADRLMVCISSHPLSERLVRAGRRLADELKTEWVVVYVETPDRIKVSKPHQARVEQTLRMAERLGAETFRISGETVPSAVIDFAHKHNVTKLIIGKPLRSRWVEMLQGSIVDEIIRRSGKIDVYIISDERGPIQTAWPKKLHIHSSLLRYLESTLLMLLIGFSAYPLSSLIDPVNLIMLFLGGVVLSAFYLGRGPSLLASLLGVLIFDFFFVDPLYSFSVSDSQYLITFTSLIVVGLVISSLTYKVRSQIEAIRRREEKVSTLYALSHELAQSVALESVLDTVVRQIGKTFGREVAILLKEEGPLKVTTASPGLELSEDDYAVAGWAFEHAHSAGRGTDTLPAALFRFEPLTTTHGVVGVLGVRPSDPGSFLSPDQRQLLEAYTDLAAMAIERARLAEQASHAQVARATEKLQTALLNSISHDLRTPLASITGVFSSLQAAELGRDGLVLDAETRLDLIENGLEEADRLNRLVANLLDMTRLEAGSLRINRQAVDLQEVVGSAVRRLHNTLVGRPLKLQVGADLPPVQADFVLLEQVLINLLDNAAKYSPDGSLLELTAQSLQGEIRLSIRDHGEGIPPADLEKIFDKFYRVHRPDGVTGSGLGLSICRGIIEAHNGRIWAENHPDGGALFHFTLPV
jgi:two-component system sensor histidine kinase KdpD